MAVRRLLPVGKVARVKVVEPFVIFAVPMAVPLLRKVTRPVVTGVLVPDTDAVKVMLVP